MGVELKKAAQKTFKKHTDTALQDVVNGDLFDQSPAACPRRFLGNPTNATSLSAGDDVKLEFDGNTLIGTRGIIKILEADTPLPMLSNMSVSGVVWLLGPSPTSIHCPARWRSTYAEGHNHWEDSDADVGRAFGMDMCRSDFQQ